MVHRSTQKLLADSPSLECTALIEIWSDENIHKQARGMESDTATSQTQCLEEPCDEEGNSGPVPKKDNYQWKEITTDFFHSIEELELGELLHYEMFGLFEAMSAIEMMDKKMDIGMIEEKEKNTPLTFEVAVEVRRKSRNRRWLIKPEFL